VRPSDWSPVGLDSDPTPGDPVLVLSGGQEYQEVARSIDNAASAMSRLDVDGIRFVPRTSEKYKSVFPIKMAGE
jgi:hypothetical protein